MLNKGHFLCFAYQVGSERTACKVLRDRSDHLLFTKKISFNLENCHAMIIFDDADLDEVLPAAIRGR